MPSNRTQQVWLGHELLGRITSRSRTSISYEYDDSILEQYPLNTPVLSCSLPTRRGRHNARAFMAGLLPEGDARRFLAQQAGCVSTDVFALLDTFGKDVAGAVWIGEGPPVGEQGRVSPYAPAGLTSEILGLQDRPLAIYDDSALSIAGIQNKMLLVRDSDGSWGRPVNGFPSTHILKVDDQRHAGLVRAEHTCLQLARAANIDAALSEIHSISGIDYIIVERFDRVKTSDSILRIHQEDACQALGFDLESRDPRAKYEAHGGPTLKQIADVLSAHAIHPKDELLCLLDHIVFSVAIGNADHHAKNISFIHIDAEHVHLAPLYDTVPTSLWPTLSTRAAMSIGAAVDLPDVTAPDLLREAQRWGLPESTTRKHIAATLERLLEATSTVHDSGTLDVIGRVRARTQRLLDRLAGELRFTRGS